ncbi:MAG: hypothetical protein Q7J06_04170 [Bacteroidales bacterium]|nr:hypothetical protein [Bacteroidales bacterium]
MLIPNKDKLIFGDSFQHFEKDFHISIDQASLTYYNPDENQTLQNGVGLYFKSFSTKKLGNLLIATQEVNNEVIFGFGYLLSFLAEKSIFKSLQKEKIPRASLISRFIKIILLLFFSAIALVELDVATEIVIIGFAAIFITIGAISVVLTAIGGKKFVEKIGSSLKEKQP